MNGRVYDPSIGRFLSADPNIFHPYNTQDYNRYSYTTNNPLKYVDMNGFGWFSKIFKTIIKVVVVVVVIAAVVVSAGVAGAIGSAASAITGVVGLASSTIAAIATGAKIGFLAGAVSTGSLKGAFKGAIYGGASAGLAQYIGHGIGVRGMESGITKNIAHGFAQGATSRIMGGNFKDGFTGGFVGSYTGDNWLKDNTDIIASTVISSISGGVVAELGGGKFMNGARSAAFVSLFNRYNITRGSNSRGRYDRATGKIDILGRNKQQQQHERWLRTEQKSLQLDFINNFRADPLTRPMRGLHNMIENLPDLRDFYVPTQDKLYIDKQGLCLPGVNK
ncbi:MAG: hypothetical protein FE834_05345 [Gammaproteobacteria bacterium]|nr:hypothetical protein [Gammaproteobacteria bacterium]